jgi:tetratricopeptide (TPR) repeat protein
MAEVSGSHRRPIWDSGPRSRFAGFLRSAARKITVTSAGAILLTVIVVPYLYREVTRDVLLIEPFNVPRQYAEMGLTGEVMANHVSDSLDEIEKDAITKEKRVGLRPDKFVLPGDLPATIDVEVPGTKLGLKTIVEIIREVLNIQPTRVRGDVVLAAAEDAPVSITVRISGSRPALPRHLSMPMNDPSAVPQLAAEAILRDVNPFLLAVYRAEQGDLIAVAEIGREMLASPDPLQSARGHNFMSVVYAGRERWKDAAREAQKAAELAPKFPPAYCNWGFALDNQGKLAEAISKYQKAVDLDASFARWYTIWGFTLYRNAKPAEAVAKFQEAVRRDPSDPSTYSFWGLALVQKGKESEAIAKYQQAIELDSKYSPAYDAWGYALLGQKRWDEAIQKFKKAIELNHRSSTPYFGVGVALYNQKKLDDADDWFRQAVETDPENTLQYNLWGVMLFDLGKMDQAIARFRSAIQIDPENPALYFNWGEALKKLGRNEEAEEKFAKARALSPAH